MTELVILTVLFAGAVIGWMIRHWSARRQFAEHSRNRQLEQLQDLTSAEHNSASSAAMARFNTDGSQSLESRLLELEEQNSDLTKSFAIKEREADQLFQTASLVKPLEFELELATDEIRRLNTERDHQLSITQAAINSDDTQAIRVVELEQQLDIAQQEIEAIRNGGSSGADSAILDTSLSAGPDATADTGVVALGENKIEVLLAERDDLESANAELLEASKKSEAQRLESETQRLELRAELDDVKRESSDYQKIHKQSVIQIEQLQEKLRIRDDDLLALKKRVDHLKQEQAEAAEAQANNLLTEVSNSREQNDRLKETEEKLEHFDSTLARLSDLELELGSSSQRSEEMIESLQTYKEQNERLTQSLRQSESETESLRSKVKNSSQRTSELESKLSSSEEAVSRSDDEISRLSKQNESLLEQNRKFKKTLQTHTLENEKIQQKKLADLQQSTKEINQTNRKLEDTRKALADSERELLQSKAEHAERETHLSNSAAKIVSLTAASKKSESLLQSRNKEIKQLDKKLTALQKDLVAEKVVSQDLRNNVEENSQRAEKQHDVQNRKLAMQGAVAKNRASSLSQLQSHLEVVVSGKDEDIRSLESTNQGLMQWRERYAEMEKKLVIKDERIKKLDSAIEQSEIAESENQKLLQKAESHLQVVVSDKDENIRSLESTNKELLKLRESLEEKLVIKDERIKKLDFAIEQSEVTARENQKVLEQTESLQNENASLNTQIAEITGRAERLQEKNSALAKSAENQGIALEKSGQNVAELKSQLAQSKESLGQLNRQVADIPALKESIQAFQKENSDMRLQINRISVLEASIEEKDAMLEKQNKEMQQIGDKIKEGLDRKDSEIQTLQEGLAEKHAIERQLQEVQTNLVTVEQQANRIPAMQATLRNRDELIVKLNTESAALKDSQEQAAQSNKELQKQIDDKVKEIDELKASAEQLRQARQQILVLQEQTKDVERLRLDIAEKNRNLTALKERNGALDSEFKKLVAGAEDHKILEGRYRDIQSELQTLKQSSSQSQAQLQAQMQRERDQLEKRLESESTQRTQVAQRLETATNLHETLQKQIESAASERNNLQTQLTQMREEMAKAPATAEFDQLQQQALTNKAQISQLEEMLHAGQDQTNDSHSLKERLQAEEALAEALAESQKENEIEIRRMQSEMMALQESVKSYQNELAVSHKRIAELESSSNVSRDKKPAAAESSKNASKKSAQKATTQLFKPPKEKDDLKKIYGIGPVMEKTLNGLGISSYKQIAEFSKQDIERVGDAIESFSDRIERDDWVGGAHKCYEEKYRSKA